jgi:hypothetical protein
MPATHLTPADLMLDGDLVLLEPDPTVTYDPFGLPAHPADVADAYRPVEVEPLTAEQVRELLAGRYEEA